MKLRQNFRFAEKSEHFNYRKISANLRGTSAKINRKLTTTRPKFYKLKKYIQNFHKLKNTLERRVPSTEDTSIEAPEHRGIEGRGCSEAARWRTRASQGRAPVAAPTRPLAVDARRRLARRIFYATPRAPVDGRGAPAGRP